MLASLTSLGALAVIVLAAFGVGSPLLRRLKVKQDDRLGACIWSLGIGLVVCGTMLGLLGLCGWVYRPLIGVLTIAGALAGIRELHTRLPIRLWGGERQGVGSLFQAAGCPLQESKWFD